MLGEWGSEREWAAQGREEGAESQARHYALLGSNGEPAMGVASEVAYR